MPSATGAVTSRYDRWIVPESHSRLGLSQTLATGLKGWIGRSYGLKRQGSETKTRPERIKGFSAIR